MSSLPCLFVVIGQVATMNREKGGRHNQFLDKWLKEFGWLQTRGSGDDLSMICKDCTKAEKKNAFTSGCKNLHNLVPRAHVSFGQRQDTELWNNPFQESKILEPPVLRRMRALV